MITRQEAIRLLDSVNAIAATSRNAALPEQHYDEPIEYEDEGYDLVEYDADEQTIGDAYDSQDSGEVNEKRQLERDAAIRERIALEEAALNTLFLRGHRYEVAQ